MIRAWLIATFCGCLAAYTAYGVATSDSPWHEVLFTLLMRFEAPWFDIGDRAPRVASALAFWLMAATFVVLLIATLWRAGVQRKEPRPDVAKYHDP